MMTSILEAAFRIVVILVVPPLLLGIIVRTKAIVAGRVGAPLLQPYFDIWKLLHKRSVISKTTTWMFVVGPVVALVCAIIAATLVPIGSSGAVWSFTGDFVALAYLLGLARYVTIAAALDTGSAFEGMGAAREATFACVAEPAFVLGLLVIARATGALSIAAFLGPAVVHVWSTAAASLVLVAAGLFVVLLAENSRMPVDDPTTHLELTMIHEVMILDHGGPLLGIVLYGASIKLFVFASLLVKLVAPVFQPAWAAWFVYGAGLAAVAVVIGLVESVIARLRMPLVPMLLLAAVLFSALALVLLMRVT